MTKSRLHPNPRDTQFDRLLDEIFSGANPNPSRIGCPLTATLFELSNSRRDINDPRWEHLAKCSPCYRDFMAMRSNGEASH